MHETHGFSYSEIDSKNTESFLLHENWDVLVLQSLHSAGPSREHKLARTILAGNMSPLNGYGPHHLTDEEKIQDAARNLETFFQQYNINPSRVRILRPERDYTTPLTAINLDEAPMEHDDTGLLRPTQTGDLLYTHNPDIVLAARPADCPIIYMTAETAQGTVTSLVHLAWLGAAHGYIAQARETFDTLGVDWPSARLYMTPGAHGSTYTFHKFDKYNPHEAFPDTQELFVDLVQDGENSYSFGINLSQFVYNQMLTTFPIRNYQVFADTTNTTAPEAGYSSHSRSFKNYPEDGANTRDIVLAVRRTS